VTSAAILSVQGLTKRFGGVVALDQVSFSVTPGCIAGLIGPNGAGKSTFFNVLTGVFPVDAGEMHFDSERINGLAPHTLVSMGLVRTFQKVHPFRGMSVLESVMVARHARTRAGLFMSLVRLPWVAGEEQKIRDDAHRAIAFVGLQDYTDDPAETLPLGRQRLLQLACGIATEPRLLFLDEPASGLNTSETSQLGQLLQAIRQQGITIVLVEHDMSLVMKICDHITVLNFGQVLADGTPKQIRLNPDVIRAYLGAGEPHAGH
jgi:ABC-type branched-subunit amino acid transport system ATPase component